jgi:hypothetical protein
MIFWIFIVLWALVIFGGMFVYINDQFIVKTKTNSVVSLVSFSITATIISFIGFLFVWAIVSIIGEVCIGGVYVRSESTPIVSLRTNNPVSGSFVLGCGTIKGEERYVFMVHKGNGVYVRNNVSVDVPVKESNNQKPGLYWDIYRGVGEGTWLYPWVICEKKNHVLVVPVGTIVQTFKIE